MEGLSIEQPKAHKPMTVTYPTLNLCAVWTPNVYKITLDNQSADSGSAGTTAYYEKYNTGWYTTDAATATITSITKPAKTGYTFGGYYANQNCSGTQYIDKNGKIVTTVATTTFTKDTTIYACWNANNYTITYGTVTGLSSVSLDGQSCDKLLSAGGCTKSLTYNQSYTLTDTAAAGYTFTNWTKTAGQGTMANNTSATSASFTVGAGTATLTPSTTPIDYNITVKFGTGITSVKLGESICSTASGCTYGLTHGKSYTMSVTLSDGYNFSTWAKSSGSGSIASATSTTNASFTVNAGDAVLTASATPKTYTITYGITTGISSVTLDGQNCTSTSCTKSLTYGQEYTLTATASTGYTFSSWSKTAGVGTLASANSASVAKEPLI